VVFTYRLTLQVYLPLVEVTRDYRRNGTAAAGNDTMPGKMAPIGYLDSLRARIGGLLTTGAARNEKRKPAALSYGLEERPPAVVTWVSAAQHVGVCAIFMVYPLIIAREATLSADQLSNVLQLGFLVLAVAVLLQALPAGPIGSRMLAPAIFTGVYLAPSLQAVKVGGLPLVWGMTIFAGLVEIILSRAWSRLRPFIPPESAGLVIFLVGNIIALAALRVLLQDSPSGALAGRDEIVCGCALAVMAGLNIWNRGRLRLFCILIGMVSGYFVSGFVGLLTLHDLGSLRDRPLFVVPHLSDVTWRFEWSLVVPFAVTGLAAAMNSTAVLTTYQRLTDAEWVRPDMNSIGRGILGDGIAAIVAGLLGTYGLTVSSANVGLVAATGVASRVIGFAIALMLAVVALQPMLIGAFAIMPRPVMAAAMIFTAVFIMISGVQIISSRVLDGRRTLVVGMGVLSFYAVTVNPGAFANAPNWAQPLVTSPLVLATLVTLLLNSIFRIGIRRKVEIIVDPTSPDAMEITNFIERNAGIWGARRDVISRIEFAVQQTVDSIVDLCDSGGAIRLEIGFDEFVIDVVISYKGNALEFPERQPSHEEIIELEEGHRRLAGFLIRSYADRIRASERDDQINVHLHFDH
jgi:xanthine permease XanP